MQRRMLILGIMGSCAVLAGLPQPSRGLFGVGDVVHDPLNYVVNTLTSIRSLASNAHEITLLNQDLEHLANEARQLAALPVSLVQQVQGTWARYNALMQQGRTMAYQVQQSVRTFDQLFSTSATPPLQRLSAIFNEIRATGRLVTQVQSIYEDLCATAARAEQLGHASQAAVGQLQAVQAGNQLQLLTVQQLSTLSQLTATQQRFDTLRYMEQVVEEDLAQQRAAAWMAGWGGVPNSQGFKLP